MQTALKCPGYHARCPFFYFPSKLIVWDVEIVSVYRGVLIPGSPAFRASTVNYITQ